MKDLIKEVALEVAREMYVGESAVVERYSLDKFLELGLVELSKRAEAVACWKDSEARNRVIFPPMKPESGDDGWLPLFTFPPIHDIEAIENRVAEACAKVYLETYDLTDIADDVRSGEWRKHK